MIGPHRISVLCAAALLVAVGGRAEASADKPAAPTIRLLESLQSSTASADERLAAARQLADTAADRPIKPLVEFLQRPRKTTPTQRRALLRSIGAAVPDKRGKFRAPGRQKKDQIKKNDEFDWLAKLTGLDATKLGVAESVADIAVIRALASSREAEAGIAILAFAFSESGMPYRDECGRYLRHMAPYSVPALIYPAASRKKYDSKRRYARYQLERLDLQNPRKALRAAEADDDLLIALLKAYGESHYRQAVKPVLETVDHQNPRVRKAAREAWLGYATGPAPPPAPMRKLKLPGNKMTEKEKPLWLNYRKLARIELKRKLEEVLGQPTEKRKMRAMSDELFAYYNSRRAGRIDRTLDAGLKAAEGAEWEQAVAAFDEVLAKAPEHARRAEMAPAYLARARQLQDAKTWKQAAAEFAKAHAVAPQGEHAKEALAGHYYALGEAARAAGGDGSALFKKATEIQPKHRAATKAITGVDPEAGARTWMFYAGLAGGLCALLLLGIGLFQRRRS